MALIYRVRTVLSGAVVVGGGVNVLHFEAAGGSAAQAAAATAQFWTDLQSAMWQTTNWQIDPQVDTIESTTNVLTAVDSVAATSGTGLASGDPLPPQTQGRIDWFTGNIVNGRQLRGKTFVPGPTETFSGGAPTTAYLADLQSAADALIAATSAELIVYSVTHKQFFEVLSANAWNKFAVLRSRRD